MCSSPESTGAARLAHALRFSPCSLLQGPCECSCILSCRERCWSVTLLCGRKRGGKKRLLRKDFIKKQRKTIQFLSLMNADFGMLHGGMATQAARIQSQPLFWRIIPATEGHETVLLLLRKRTCALYTLYYPYAAPLSMKTQKYMALCYEKGAPKSLAEIFLQWGSQHNV